MLMSEDRHVIGIIGCRGAIPAKLMVKFAISEWALGDGYKSSGLEDECVRTIELDGRKVTVELLDMSMKDEFKETAMMLYRVIHAAVVLYSVADWESLATAESNCKQVRDARGGRFPCVIAGANEEVRKILGSDAVPEQEGVDLANKYGCKHMLVSTKTGLGVNELIETVVREYFAQQEGSKAEPVKSANTDKDENKDEDKSNGCCRVQ